MATARIIFCLSIFIGFVSAQESQPRFLGQLSTLFHNVSGGVYAIDDTTIEVRQFWFDGQAPATYFRSGTGAVNGNGFRLCILPECNGRNLGEFRGQTLRLQLPQGQTVANMDFLTVWCEEFVVSFGDITISNTQVFPTPTPSTTPSASPSPSTRPVMRTAPSVSSSPSSPVSVITPPSPTRNPQTSGLTGPRMNLVRTLEFRLQRLLAIRLRTKPLIKSKRFILRRTSNKKKRRELQHIIFKLKKFARILDLRIVRVRRRLMRARNQMGMQGGGRD